jgi:hypothetical protein
MELSWRPIEAEPTLANLPGIIGGVTVWEQRIIAVEILGIDSVMCVLT